MAGAIRKPFDPAMLARRAARAGAAPWIEHVPGDGPRDVAAWSAGRGDALRAALLERGALLFRGFDVADAAAFERFVRASLGEPQDYDYGSTPRSAVGGGIYTASEYAPALEITLHNEMSYARAWPRLLAFYCAVPASRGGETTIADSRAVYREIDPAVREPFERDGVMYVRNYNGLFDLSWQQAFQTGSREDVEERCRAKAIEWEWLAGDVLRTWQRCPAVLRHPVTGEPVWFNQAHLFHVSALGPEVSRHLVAELGEAHLSRHCYYGDGRPIDEAALGTIRDVYRRLASALAWRSGDVLVLDNVLTAHGRRPYEGTREVLVAMSAFPALGCPA